MKVAFFDLDDTILEGSSNRHFFSWCMEQKIYGFTDMLTATASGIIYKLGVVDPVNLVHFWLKRHKGWSDTNFNILMQRAFDEVIISRIRPQALEEIEIRRKEGRVVLLSASTQYICEIMGKHLNLDAVLCTRLEILDGAMSGNLDGPFVYGPEKAIAAEQYCLEHGIELKNAHYYGDAYSDRFVLEAVGHPHCISPEPGLRNLAHKNGWVIRDWSMKT